MKEINPFASFPVEFFLFNFSKNSRLFNQKYISTPEDLFESDLDFHSEVITGY